jgi:hypothetical protein
MPSAKPQRKPASKLKPVEPAPKAAGVPWIAIAIELVLTRAAIATLGVFSRMVILPGRFNYPGVHSLIDTFFRWDSGWYLGIVQQGYSYTANHQSSIAFFPLYPALVWLFSLGGILNVKVVGFLLSNVALAYGCGCLWRLTERHFGSRETADWAVALALVAPVGFFMSIFYTEGLFFCCMAACMDFAGRDRWLAAGVWGLAAGLARSTGGLLSVFLLLAMIGFVKRPPFLRLRARWTSLAWVILPGLGVISYLAFIWLKFGGISVYMNTQREWGRQLVYPWVPFQPTFGPNNGIPMFFRLLFKGSVVAVGIVAALGVVARVPLSWLSMLILIPMFSLSSAALESMPRYMSIIVPYYAVLAWTIDRWKFLKVPVLMFSCMLAALSVILFVNGYWFT